MRIEEKMLILPALYIIKRKEKVVCVTVFPLELQFLGVNVLVFPLKR